MSHARILAAPPKSGDSQRGVRIRLTCRMVRVPEAIAESPGKSISAGAEHASIADAGQISKLLAQLTRLGLVLNTRVEYAHVESNERRLTPTGRQVAQAIGIHRTDFETQGDGK